ncbi:17.9 kDa class II heat shock protein, partial [Mucuna pruriens]
MDFRVMGLEYPMFHTIHHMMDMSDDCARDKTYNAPTLSYVRDTKAMAATPADVKEYPNSYVFVIDMPGLKSGEIKVQTQRNVARN